MNPIYRIVFVGTVRASRIALRSIIAIASVRVAAVITKKHSTFNADHEDLGLIAEQHGIPYKYVRDINDSSVQAWIRSFEPTVLFVSGWSQLLDRETLSIAPFGAIGFHPALLPITAGGIR